MTTETKRRYTRSRPHNKISDKMLDQIRELLKTKVPRYRIAEVLGISRAHLYHLINQYQIEGTRKRDTAQPLPAREEDQAT